LAFVIAASMGAVTFVAAGGTHGVVSASETTASSTTLVPRPTATSPTTAPRADTAPIIGDLTPIPATEAPNTSLPEDPYQWLENVPAAGQVFLGVSTESGSPEQVLDFEAAAEVSTDVVMVSRSWADGSTADIATIEAITASGHLPIIAWEPWDHNVESTFDRRRGEQPTFALSTIIAGEHDQLIEDWADGLASWGRPVGLRFAHEMNGYWYPWSEATNGNIAGQYVEAWRHVHDIFTARGADNVLWIWSPNPTQQTLTPLAGLYPGDDYVDWIGLVGYLGNGIDPNVYTPTFDQLFGPTIDEIRLLSDLPFVITELGATELGGKKASWISHVFDAILARQDIVGVIWFEVDKETDWRIVSSPAATEAFATAVADPRFGTPRT
jgi:mannan endo-1,4-beta-mannosidase